MTHRSVLPRLTPGAVSTLTAAVIFTVFALSLGAEQVSSSLGQPLRMTVSLLGSTTDALETRCYRVVTPSRDDGLAVLTQARIELQTNTNPPQLIIRSNRPVDEPVVRITIEASCDSPMRRDYTVLLDPPPVQTPEPRTASVSPPSLPTLLERPQIATDAVAASAASVAAWERAATRRSARSASLPATAKSSAAAPVGSRGRSATADGARQARHDRAHRQATSARQA